MKWFNIILSAAALLWTMATSCGSADSSPQYEVIAYVWSGDSHMLPPPDAVTTINYCGGWPTDSRDGIKIANEERLHDIVRLKEQNPGLRVLLSMCGNNYNGWPELAAFPAKRKAFAADCLRVIEQYGLDGIEIDWEFPAAEGGTPDDIDNFHALLAEIRQVICSDKRLTVAGGASARSLKFPEILNVVDYINVMAYDMGWQAPYHHTPLYRSNVTGWHSVEESLHEFLDKGAPADRLVLGLAFYGRGDDRDYCSYTDYRDLTLKEGMTERWDSIGCVPYITDSLGTLVLGYENPRSLEIKCRYIKDHGLRGGMYWRTELDTDDHELARTVARCLINQ